MRESCYKKNQLNVKVNKNLLSIHQLSLKLFKEEKRESALVEKPDKHETNLTNRYGDNVPIRIELYKRKFHDQ